MAGFLNPDRQSENQERLEALGAGSGAADVEYEQFLKAKEAGAGSIFVLSRLAFGARYMVP